MISDYNHRVDRFAASLRYCRSLPRGREIHIQVSQSEHSNSVFLLNLLLQMYGRLGSLREARAVFDSIAAHYRNRHSWLLILQAYIFNGELHPARVLLESMPEEDIVSTNAVITAFAKRGDYTTAKHLFDRATKKNVVSWNNLLTIYTKNGLLDEAERVFDSMPEKTLVSWTIMIVAFAENGRLEKAQKLFDSLLHKDVVVWTALLKAYCDADSIPTAREMFDKMPEKNVISWTTMLTAYAHRGYVDEAKTLFDKFPDPNLVAHTAMLQAFGIRGLIREAEEIFDRIRGEADAIAWNTMLSSYAQHGHIELAVSFFDRMRTKDQVSWCIMIHAFISRDHLETAREFFDRMKEKSRAALTTMISGYVLNGMLTEARALFQQIEEPDVISCCAMVSGFGLKGEVRQAQKLFDRMMILTGDPASWGVVIGMYARNGHALRVFEKFHQMNVEGILVDRLVFTSVLAACSHLGVVKLSRDKFVSMIRDFEIDPVVEHYSTVVDVFARSGETKNAEELIDCMPFDPHLSAWMSLLAGCTIHRDKERGSRATQQLKRLHGATPYILASHLTYSLGAGSSSSSTGCRSGTLSPGLC